MLWPHYANLHVYRETVYSYTWANQRLPGSFVSTPVRCGSEISRGGSRIFRMVGL